MKDANVCYGRKATSQGVFDKLNQERQIKGHFSGLCTVMGVKTICLLSWSYATYL